MAEEKYALITASTTSLGMMISRRLVAEGVRLIIVDSKGDEAGRFADNFGGDAIALILEMTDMTDETQWAEIYRIIKEECGQLDILINNPIEDPVEIGRNISTNGAIDNMAHVARAHLGGRLDNFHHIVTAHAQAVYLASRHALPLLAESRTGTIVNIAPIDLSSTDDRLGYTDMATTQTMRAISQAIAQDCRAQGHDICCNSLSLSPLTTDIMLLARAIESKDMKSGLSPRTGENTEQNSAQAVVDMVMFLASHQARAITGAEIVI